MRYFNTSGPNIPAEHYTLPRLNLIEQGRKMVHNSRYTTSIKILRCREKRKKRN